MKKKKCPTKGFAAGIQLIVSGHNDKPNYTRPFSSSYRRVFTASSHKSIFSTPKPKTNVQDGIRYFLPDRYRLEPEARRTPSSELQSEDDEE